MNTTICLFVPDKLYVVGGSNGQNALTSVEIFDPVTQTWSFSPSLSHPRSNVGVAVVKGCLFAVGGFSGKTFLDSIEYLSEDATEWSSYVAPGNSVNVLNNNETEKDPHSNGWGDRNISASDSGLRESCRKCLDLNGETTQPGVKPNTDTPATVS